MKTTLEFSSNTAVIQALFYMIIMNNYDYNCRTIPEHLRLQSKTHCDFHSGHMQ